MPFFIFQNYSISFTTVGFSFKNTIILFNALKYQGMCIYVDIKGDI